MREALTETISEGGEEKTFANAKVYSPAAEVIRTNAVT
jgi:hypothetical protein